MMEKLSSRGWVIGLLIAAGLILLVMRERKQEMSTFWTTDFQKAKETAAAEGKDLFLNFSGSDWCYWCKRLDREVFGEPLFLREAGEQFVFVLVDFPNDKSHQSIETQQQNERLAEQFRISGFPTIILTDSNGLPYARTGYLEGGVRNYLEHLKELGNQKIAP